MPALRPAALACALLAVSFAAPAAAAPKPEPWEGAAFSARPRALLEAAARRPAPPDAPAEVLLEEARFRLDETGAAVFTHRIVFRVLTAEGARAWARVDRAFAPWRQARPELRARVIAPDGQVFEPPATAFALHEGGDGAGGVDVVRASLPGLVPGAVVEEEAVVRDLRPAFRSGTSTQFFLARATPARLVRALVEAPASLPLRWEVLGLPAREATVREEVKHGVRRLHVERRDVPAVVALEGQPPRDAAPVPFLALGWGGVPGVPGAPPSWAAPAAELAQAFETALAGADVAALAKDTFRPGLPATREEAVAKVAAFFRDHLHAVASARGAPLVPAAPAETLARGEGDADDLAALAIALLRGAGVAARPAAIRAAWQEVLPGFPSLDAFDRVVVAIPGEPALWFDPATPWTVPGRLPPPLEGRLALVGAPGADALVRTPADPTLSTVTVTRDVALADLGHGRVVERRESRGPLAAAERVFWSSDDRDELAKRYVRGSYGASAADDLRLDGLADPAAPLVLTVEVADAPIARSDDDEAEATVAPDAVFQELPPFLLGIGGPALPGPLAEEARAAAAPRRFDLVLEAPHRWELAWRVRPPAGFRARPLPSGLAERFGPARFEAVFGLAEDGSVTATYTFDTGGRVIPAADADRLARFVRQVGEDRGLVVSFERVGAALLAAGQVPGALAEMRRVAAAHPRAAVHRIHLALALLRLGFGDAAAAEARRATALEPDRAWAFRVLGFVLEHDAFGRRHGPGFDHAGALAAYRTAKRLDPDSAAGRAALAELLAHDPSGRRYGPGARLDEAVEEYRAVREDLDDKDFGVGYLSALVAAGRLEQAEALARALPNAPGREAALVAAAAALRGGAAGLAAAPAAGDARRDALVGAAWALVRLRRYEAVPALVGPALELLPAADPRRATMARIARVRPVDDAPGDEVEAFLARVAAAAAGASPVKALSALFAAGAVPASQREAVAGAVDASLGVSAIVRAQEVPPPVARDLAFALWDLQREGDPASGLRLQLGVVNGQPISIYAVRDGGTLALVGPDAGWTLLAGQALRRLEADDLAGARRWLDWARRAAPGEAGDPATAAGLLAALLPGVDPEAWDAPAVRRAAAALVRDPGGAGLAELVRARAAAASPAERRALDFARAHALAAASRFGPLLELARGLQAGAPPSRAALSLELYAAEKLRRPAAVAAAATRVRAASEGDPEALALAAGGRLVVGDLAGARRDFRAVVADGKVSPGTFNNAAWLELFFPPLDPAAVEWARRAANRERAGHTELNTLAAVLALAGKPGEALEAFRRSLDAKGDEGAIPADYLVLGLLAEAWKQPELARFAYARTTPEPEDPTAPHLLARRRLAALGKGPSLPEIVAGAAPGPGSVPGTPAATSPPGRPAAPTGRSAAPSAGQKPPKQPAPPGAPGSKKPPPKAPPPPGRTVPA